MDKNRKIFRLGNNEPVETPPQLRMKSYDYKDLIKEAYEISTKNSNDFVIKIWSFPLFAFSLFPVILSSRKLYFLVLK